MCAARGVKLNVPSPLAWVRSATVLPSGSVTSTFAAVGLLSGVVVRT